MLMANPEPILSRAQEQQLALRTAYRAAAGADSRGEPKVGVEELMSIAERFGFSGETLSKVRSAIEGEDIGQGPFLASHQCGLEESKVEAFQRIARQVFGVEHAIGASSGTGALHAALVAVGVGPGTEVICPAIGFYATAAAVVMAKGVPIFCDVDSSMCMDPRALESCITTRTVALAPTHVMGAVCDMAAIMEVARRHRLLVVEDAAQACGARYADRYVGTIGDIGCFSISAYKIIGGGEGGLVLTHSERLSDRALGIIEGGGLWRPDRFAAPRYEGELFCGTNYRMSELEACVDVVQLAKLGATVERFRGVKRQIVGQLGRYAEITPQTIHDVEGQIGYLLRFYPKDLELGASLAAALKAEGLDCSFRGSAGGPDWHLYSDMFPITLAQSPSGEGCPFQCPIYRQRGGSVSYARGDCPVADDLFNRVISVNLNQWYSDIECRRVAAVLNKVFDAYCTADSTAPPWH